MSPEAAEIVVHKILKDLFDARKKESVPPFFAVIEEAHLFCPEKVFSEAKSTKILRTIASEGRKFGLGICIVTQRPARVDKSVGSAIAIRLNPPPLKSAVKGLAPSNL
jgi:DNA helicase HerA-like ATPase